MNRPNIERITEVCGTVRAYECKGCFAPVSAPQLIAYIAHLESQLGIAREAIEFYRDWATRPYQEKDYPHNRFGFVQYDVHRALIDALAKLNNGTQRGDVGANTKGKAND